MECYFCKIYQNKSKIIYENKYFFAKFDEFPVNPGHAEIMPKKHIVSLLDLTKNEWKNLQSSLFYVVKQIEQTDFKEVYQKFSINPVNNIALEYYKKMLNHLGINKKPDAYNFGINDGKASGRTIDHLHIHIIPRFFGDVENCVGGVRNIVPGMGNYKG